jgi:hypothetical protein
MDHKINASAVVVNPPASGRPNGVKITAQEDTEAGALRAASTAVRAYLAAHPDARVLSRACVWGKRQSGRA